MGDLCQSSSQTAEFQVLTDDFDFHLPSELIAQQPVPRRDSSRLLVVHRAENCLEHRAFSDLPSLLRPGDVLVLNDSRVIPARLRAVNPLTGGALEIFLLEENQRNDWWVMVRPGKRAPIGFTCTLVSLSGKRSSVLARVIDTNEAGHRRVEFSGQDDIRTMLGDFGEVPLPPYIKRKAGLSTETDLDRYQTVYAQQSGSVAAPTAGLHFTEELLAELRNRGVEICHVTLHVGLGTFAPVKVNEVQEHVMHHERFHVASSAAETINLAKAENRRVLAVGTTAVRVLESVARLNDGRIAADAGKTNIFIYPPYKFQIVDGLVTNFHLPRSTLLMLVSALAAPGDIRGREMILAAYEEAIQKQYRFFSYGDAMLIL